MQNSSYSVAKQYLNNTKRTQKNPPYTKKTEKTTPNRHPKNTGGTAPAPTRSDPGHPSGPETATTRNQ